MNEFLMAMANQGQVKVRSFNDEGSSSQDDNDKQD